MATADAPHATDPTTLAELDESGLRYVSDTEPGLARLRAGRGFRYVDARGSPATTADRTRIRALAIPPAWADVWICRHAGGHIQATGRDRAGRKQYLYHPEWVRLRAEAKFDRLGTFGRQLPRLRRTVAADLDRRGLGRRRLTALAVRLLDETLIRVGTPRHEAANGTHGLTTLEERHVEIDGTELVFAFVGKGGVDQEVSVRDRQLAHLVGRCLEAGGSHLLATAGGRGVDASDVNDYIRSATGDDDFSAKDFRTWGASAAVTAALGPIRPEPDDTAAIERTWLEALDAAADLLGNTRAVCRASYVHPGIEDAFRDGWLASLWQRSRSSRWMGRGERTLVRLLE